MQIKFALLFTVGMCACGQAQVSPLIDSSVFENGLSPPIVALPNDAVVDGKSLSEWTVEWWKWVFAIHTNENPEFDLDGSRAATHQSDGPVFFVAGVITFSGSATRHFQVPAGKYLFFPVLNVYSDNVNVIPPEPIEQLRADNAAFLDAITDLKARIDGVAVPDLFAHRIISPVFSFDFTFPDNLESYAT